MLAHRVIPIMLCRGRTLVKGQRFDSWRSVGHAAQAVRIHQARGVDELILLDIGATPEGRGPDLSLVAELSECCFMPLTVGGGIKSVADEKALLAAGADKVSIGTAAVENAAISEITFTFGAQAVVASLDVKAGRVYSRCGAQSVADSQMRTDDPIVVADSLELLGCGEILLTSIDREGTMQGYDLELIRAVSRQVSIPVIANGGCSGPEDMAAAIEAGASAVAAGALFQFTDITPKQCAQYLAKHGIEARI